MASATRPSTLSRSPAAAAANSCASGMLSIQEVAEARGQLVAASARPRCRHRPARRRTRGSWLQEGRATAAAPGWVSWRSDVEVGLGAMLIGKPRDAASSSTVSGRRKARSAEGRGGRCGRTAAASPPPSAAHRRNASGVASRGPGDAQCGALVLLDERGRGVCTSALFSKPLTADSFPLTYKLTLKCPW